MRKTAVLRIYKGSELLQRANGTFANENQEMSLTYNDLRWPEHLQNIKKMGVCKVEVVKFYDGNEEAEIPKELTAEIEALLKKPQTVLTPEQQQIKDLEAKVEALLSAQGKAGNKQVEEKVNPLTVENVKVNEPETVNKETQSDRDLAEARAKYLAKFGKEVPAPFKNKIEWINKELEKTV